LTVKGEVVVVVLQKVKNPDYALNHADNSQDYFSLRKMWQHYYN